MLISVLITWLTLFFLSKLLSLKPLPPLTSSVRLVSCWWFWREGRPPLGSSAVCEESHKTEDDAGEILSILDLPDLVLECILQKQPPDALCRMASVCSDLRDMCLSDHLWERHMRAKWGRVIGSTARQGWRMAVRNDPASLEPRKDLLGIILRKLWPFPWVQSRSDCKITSLVAWYSALESGKLWFPAQVYNRENNHVGFILSCYDAELSYDHSTETFKARYLPHGIRRPVAVEDGVAWERIRAPPVRTSPRDLHVSDCLSDLRPGDHVEIQWRRNKEFPYDAVVLEFNQYAPSSRWRRTLIDRKDHREEGNEGRGFYGGIRKISSQDEISVWKRLWPTQPLE
uniref:F-box domain-containing protein n=1 Tax=Kalanchoe fedtschenkoi TaxID=63787 RepID=A0A7N0UF44_KALFE